MSASLHGVWKLSFSARRPAAPLSRLTAVGRPTRVPTRLRFLDPPSGGRVGRVELPVGSTHFGAWRVWPGGQETSGAQLARFMVGTDDARLRFDGLYDGERIAGTVRELVGEGVAEARVEEEPSAEDVELGEFLCTRLFTFWGTPTPSAGRGHSG